MWKLLNDIMNMDNDVQIIIMCMPALSVYTTKCCDKMCAAIVILQYIISIKHIWKQYFTLPLFI